MHFHLVFVVLKGSLNPLLASMIKHLNVRSIEVSVIVLGYPGPLAEQCDALGTRFFALRADRSLAAPLAARRLRRLLHQLAPDIVHAHLFAPSLALALAARRSRKFGTVLTRHHNQLHHLSRKRIHSFLDAWSAGRVDRVIAVSDAVRRTLSELEGVDPSKISVVHTGIDPSDLTPDPRRVKEWRSQLGEGPLFVAVGRLSPEKDYETMLRAFAEAGRRIGRATLAVAGSGEADADASLRGLAERLGVSDQIRFLGWVEDVHNLLSAADLFVHSSIDEAFSLTILEALMLGVPMAVTTAGGTIEAVGDFYDAVQPHDASALANQMVDRVTSPDSASVAARASEKTRKRFTPEAMIEGHLEVYESVYPRAHGRRD